MLASKSKLSRFTATNGTITASVHQAMKNSKGQEHQRERDKKVATMAEGEKLEYPKHASAFFFQLKVKLPKLSNLGNTRMPQNLHKKNNLHVLLYVSLHDDQTLHYITIDPKLISRNVCLVIGYDTQASIVILYFSFFFLLLYSMKSQANEEDNVKNAAAFKRIYSISSF